MPPPLYVLLLLSGLLLSSLHTPPCSAAIADGDTLMVGQALSVGEKLVSRNGKFALGFFQPQPTAGISKSINTTTNTLPGWYLGIWFNKIQVFTTAWVANS
jgi:hypothetical protein